MCVCIQESRLFVDESMSIVKVGGHATLAQLVRAVQDTDRSQVRVLHVAHLIVSAINLQFLIIFGSEGVNSPSSL